MSAIPVTQVRTEQQHYMINYASKYITTTAIGGIQKKKSRDTQLLVPTWLSIQNHFWIYEDISPIMVGYPFWVQFAEAPKDFWCSTPVESIIDGVLDWDDETQKRYMQLTALQENELNLVTGPTHTGIKGSAIWAMS